MQAGYLSIYFKTTHCFWLLPWKAICDRAQPTPVQTACLPISNPRTMNDREMLAAPNSYFFTVLRCNRRYKPRDTPYSQSTMTQDKMWGKIWLFQSNNNAKLICYLGHACFGDEKKLLSMTQVSYPQFCTSRSNLILCNPGYSTIKALIKGGPQVSWMMQAKPGMSTAF